MQFRASLFLVGAALLPLAQPGLNAGSPSLEALPFAFEPADHSSAVFVARSFGSVVSVSANQLSFIAGRESVEVRLAGAAAGAKAEPGKLLTGVSHYFTGADRRQWRSNVPRYATVRYREIWPGIDVLYYGREGSLEFDFTLAPGADPRLIRFELEEPSHAVLESSGALLIRLPGGELRLLRPEIVQGGVPLEARYVLDRDTVRFEIGGYDRSKPLTIDPVIVYSTYLGGGGTAAGGSDLARAVALDAAGNIYLAGQTQSRAFPVSATAQQKSNAGGYDVFLAKLTPDASSIIWSTYLGGAGADDVSAIAVSGSGVVGIAGRTNSAKFPFTDGAFQAAPGGGYDAFVASFDGEGKLLCASLMGGAFDDAAQALAFDQEGNLVLAGYTSSPAFPTTAGAAQSALAGARNAFVARLNASASTLLAATLLGGGNDEGRAVAVDPAGRIVIAGQSASGNFPVTPGAARTRRSMGEGFVAVLDASMTSVLASTYVGGGLEDYLGGMIVDSAGTVWVGGHTRSIDLPVTSGAVGKKNSGLEDAFLLSLDPMLAKVQFVTYFGGTGSESVAGLVTDAAGDLIAAGATNSSDLPVPAGLAPAAPAGLRDGFVAVFSAAKMELSALITFGGSGQDLPQAIAVSPEGVIHVYGSTASPNFPATSGAFQTALQPGGYDTFLTILEPLAREIRASTYFGGAGSTEGEEALDLAVDAAGNAYIAGWTLSIAFPATTGALQANPAALATGDAFVAKIAPDGKTLVWATYLGGSGADSATGIAVDSNSRVTIAGVTDSQDFPLSKDAAQKKPGGYVDTFIARIADDGSSLEYSTLLGGGGNDTASGVALAPDGSAVVAGTTGSWDFPTTSEAYQKSYGGGVYDGFAARVAADGASFPWITYFGTPGWDSATSVAVEASGSVWIAGTTDSPGLQVTAGAAQAALAGSSDAFAAKLSGDGASLQYATYFGGSSVDSAEKIRVDPSGNLYIAGSSGSPTLPATVSAPQKTNGGSMDGFVAKIPADGSKFLWATFLGGVTTDVIHGLAVDSSGSTYVAGSALTFNFPTTDNRLQQQSGGPPDAFVARLDADGGKWLYSSLLGGAGNDNATAIAVDASGGVWVAGSTASANFPVSATAFQRVLSGPSGAFVARFDFTRETVRLIPAIRQVLNHATGLAPLAAGSVIAILGENLADGEVTVANPTERVQGQLPMTAGGATVMHVRSNRGIPLFSVSPGRIVGQMPYSALGIEELYVVRGGETGARFQFGVFGSAAGIYSVSKADGTVASKDSPFRPGDPVVIRLTGAGLTVPTVSSGQPVPDSPAFEPREKVGVQIQQGSTTVQLDQILAYQLVPGTVGIASITAKIHNWVSSDNNEWELSISSGGGWSNKVKIYIYAPSP